MFCLLSKDVCVCVEHLQMFREMTDWKLVDFSLSAYEENWLISTKTISGFKDIIYLTGSRQVLKPIIYQQETIFKQVVIYQLSMISLKNTNTKGNTVFLYPFLIQFWIKKNVWYIRKKDNSYIEKEDRSNHGIYRGRTFFFIIMQYL